MGGGGGTGGQKSSWTSTIMRAGLKAGSAIMVGVKWASSSWLLWLMAGLWW